MIDLADDIGILSLRGRIGQDLPALDMHGKPFGVLIRAQWTGQFRPDRSMA
ncbi:hypothetical protein [Plantibacter sp. CFBP 8804]|uniref:hypothetical protein n=1 Tax=Plantibacter sp. CFBP 8804 TaxID=2775270 RepID=UPI001785553F|nr:hypothetical protein [Plantibacter sp. CFBP 8804]MBD8518627.1 hypothetical protein [Plantibacter sp. CFBP 8804]